MEDFSNLTLAEIVNKNFLAATVFEKYNLDFCCRGNRQLKEACMTNNLPLETIIEELKIIGQSNNSDLAYEQLSFTQLADYIVLTHHEYIKNAMPVLYRYLLKVATKHAAIFPELKKIFQIFVAIKKEMEIHLHQEETVLFPGIKKLEASPPGEKNNAVADDSFLETPIHLLEEEHNHAENFFEEIKELTNNYSPLSTACTMHKLCFSMLQSFEKDLEQHTHLENNILFPKALKLLGLSHSG